MEGILKNMTNNLQMAQLLCTRLCHDMAGPVGAVSAGVELMGTDPSLIDDETLSLLSGSAEAASRKLKFLRVAFGWAGSGSPPLDQVGGFFGDYLIATTGPSGGPTLTWPDKTSLDLVTAKLGDLDAQSMANIALLGLEVQPGCRTLSINAGVQGGELTVSVFNKPSRETFREREDIANVIRDNESAAMTPQTVHAYLACQLFSQTSGRFVLEVVPDGVVTTVIWQ